MAISKVMVFLLTIIICVPVASVYAVNVEYATAVTVAVGIYVSGNLYSLDEVDGNYYHVHEINPGTPAFNVVFTYKNPSWSDVNIVLHGRYEGNAAHTVKIRIRNYTSGLWDDVTAMINDLPSSLTDSCHVWPYIITSDNVSGGNIQIAIVHNSNGSAGHDLLLDQLVLTETVPSPEYTNSMFLFIIPVALLMVILLRKRREN